MMTVNRAFRLTMTLTLLPSILLGLWLGQLTAATPNPVPQQLTLTSHSSTPFSHFGSRWHSVTQALGDALAEGSADDATTRDWERCMIRIPMRGDRNRMTFVICPDGLIEHW